MPPPSRAALEGVLLGTALGDSLGLPAEGLSAAAIARRWGRVRDFHLLGKTGFVSDDTELAALTAQSLALAPGEAAACARRFQRALAGWLLRLPWGIGLATLRAGALCVLGLEKTGVASAGNGAATRMPVVGVFFRDEPERRRAFARALAETTHTEPRGWGAAVFAAEVAALAGAQAPAEACRSAAAACGSLDIRAAVDSAIELCERSLGVEEAARRLGNTGYAVHTAALAAFVFTRYADRPLEAVVAAISAGGDTDSIAALVGAWCGARLGAGALPQELLERVHDGPFGPTHLLDLAKSLAEGAPPPDYSAAGAMLRNLALYPVILAHGLRRLIPL